MVAGYEAVKLSGWETAASNSCEENEGLFWDQVASVNRNKNRSLISQAKSTLSDGGGDEMMTGDVVLADNEAQQSRRKIGMRAGVGGRGVL